MFKFKWQPLPEGEEELNDSPGICSRSQPPAPLYGALSKNHSWRICTHTRLQSILKGCFRKPIQERQGESWPREPWSTKLELERASSVGLLVTQTKGLRPRKGMGLSRDLALSPTPSQKFFHGAIPCLVEALRKNAL